MNATLPITNYIVEEEYMSYQETIKDYFLMPGKTSLFIPTCRPGGIDVFEHCLKTQTEKPDVLVVCDNLKRKSFWKTVAAWNNIDEFVYIDPPLIFGEYKRNLARAYNLACEESIYRNCDLLISLQDYIWIPEYGIQRFKFLHKKLGNKFLYTGLCSIGESSKNELYSLDDNYSIFKNNYSGKPDQILWKDVRYELYSSYIEGTPDGIITTNDPNHYEMNWAAFPLKLYQEGLLWDEEMDYGMACENNLLAFEAINKYDCNVVLDHKNWAISLPHFTYFPADKEALVKFNNIERYERKKDEFRDAS